MSLRHEVAPVVTLARALQTLHQQVMRQTSWIFLEGLIARAFQDRCSWPGTRRLAVARLCSLGARRLCSMLPVSRALILKNYNEGGTQGCWGGLQDMPILKGSLIIAGRPPLQLQFPDDVEIAAESLEDELLNPLILPQLPCLAAVFQGH